MPLPIIINGACGKMGIEIARIVLADTALSLAGCIEREGHPSAGQDYGECIGKGTIGLKVATSLDQVTAAPGIIIDFSSPQSTAGLLKKAFDAGLRLVIGTTGLSDADYTSAKVTSERVPLLLSPNMSMGVNLLFYLTEFVTSRLKNDFDIEIIELHHRFKKDSPSGTAKKLGEVAATARGLSYDRVVRHGRSGLSENDRPAQEIGMHSVRGGDITGDHTVLFAGIGERIELRHMAHNRTPLARGAVAAAKWLASKGPGLYSMRDVLGM